MGMRLRILRQLFVFLWHARLWWLALLLVLLLVAGLLVAVAQSSAVAPFIYTLF
jgi:hypothetical protein